MLTEFVPIFFIKPEEGKTLNFVIANLRYYPRATPPLLGMIELSVFPKDATVSYAQCGHRTSNRTITI